MKFVRSGAVVIDANVVDKEIARGRRACTVRDFQVQVKKTDGRDGRRNRRRHRGDNDCLSRNWFVVRSCVRSE